MPLTSVGSRRSVHSEMGVRAERLAEAAAGHIIRFKVLYLVLISLIYFADTCFRATKKLFWFDEIFTVLNARLPDIKTIWEALRGGADLNPPMLYVLTRASERLFGEGPVSVRLPEILGFWIFCLCLYRFVSVRSTPLAGMVTMIFPWVTQAYWYAYEARPHGIVLGLCGVSIVCWQSATTSKRRLPWLIGLTASLAAALLTHSFAVLLFGPLVVGELVRSYLARKIDWPIWAAMGIAAPAILTSLPLLRNARKMLDGVTMFHPTFSLASSYIFLLGPSLLVAAGAFFLLAADLLAPQTAGSSKAQSGFEVVPHEIALAIGLSAAPLFGILLSNLARGPFLHRYALCAVGGCAYLAGIAAARCRTRIVSLLLLALLLFGVAKHSAEFVKTRRVVEPVTGHPLKAIENGSPLEQYTLLDHGVEGDLPIVVLDDLDFLQIHFYAPPELRDRLWYVVWKEPDINAEGYRALNRWSGANVKITDAPSFLAAHPRFLAYA